MPDPAATRWSAVEEFVAASQNALAPLHGQVDELLHKWDERWRSAGFDGDPTHRDWRDFEPLQRSRENACSDWLAFLLRASKTGVPAWRLFGQGKGEGEPGDYARPTAVRREVGDTDHRCDLLIEWRHGLFAHVEVKTGDPHLDKTPETGKRMRLKMRAEADDWSNFILLLSSQRAAWSEVEPLEGEPPTHPRTWVDAAIAVRQGVASGEDAVWRACAYLFIGAVEQRVVGYPGYAAQPMESVREKLRILGEGWRNE